MFFLMPIFKKGTAVRGRQISGPFCQLEKLLLFTGLGKITPPRQMDPVFVVGNWRSDALHISGINISARRYLAALPEPPFRQSPILVPSCVRGKKEMETHMKFTVPGIVITALLMASPAFAQYGSPGNTSAPGASVTKDDSWSVATQVKKHVASHKQKKHMANYKQRHHAKAMSSKAQATGSDSSSAPGASTTKDATTPKSR